MNFAKLFRTPYLILLCLPFLSGCDNDDSVSDPGIHGLPRIVHLTGSAQTTTGQGITASCNLDLMFEIFEETSRDSELVTYEGTHGGEVWRRVFPRQGAGFEFQAVVAGAVNFRLLRRTGVVTLEIPINQTARGRFWREMARFEGTVDQNGHGSGTWTCAPLDINQPGYTDTSIVVTGPWQFDRVVQAP